LQKSEVMKIKIIVLLIFRICFQFVSNGQDFTPDKALNLFGIYTGYSRHIIRDEVASPLIYSGTQMPVVLTYRHIGNKSRQSFTFYHDKLELNSSITDKSGPYLHYSDNLNLLLDYSYNRKIFAISPVKTDCFLGVKLLSVMNYRNFHYYDGNSIAFVEQLNSLGINLLMEKKLSSPEGDYLRFNINVPLISYVILNNRYNSVVSETFNKIDFTKNVLWQVFTNGEVVTLNKLAEYQTELSYTRFLTKHLGFEFEYRLHFYNFSQYKNLLHVRSLSYQYLIGFIVKL
jgi:hypothetical protein